MKLKKSLFSSSSPIGTSLMLQLCIILMLCLSATLEGKKFSTKKSVQKAFEKANAHIANDQHEKAAKIYRRILRSRNDLPEIYFNLGVCYMHLKLYADAISAFQNALQLKPDNAKAIGQLGRAYLQTDKAMLAETMFNRALAYEPHNWEFLVSLAELYAKDNRFDESIEAYLRARALQPKNMHVLLGLANTLNTSHHTEKALTTYFDLLELAPHNPSILYNIAYTLKKLNRLDEALDYYHRVLEINPNHTEAHFSYGLALLLTGNKCPENWIKGWTEYEWRWQRQDKQLFRQYTQPVWKGSDLHGKTLFIWSEQSLADQFQFIRYAQVAKHMGARKVIVAVHDAVYDILKLCPYIDQVIRNNDQAPAFDYHIPMLSMPHYTKTKLHSTPKETPYLFADPSLVELWKEKMNNDTNFRIGICWQENPNYTTQFLRMAAAAKSMTITEFLPLTELPGVSVYSLQKVSGTEYLNLLPENTNIITFEGDFDQSNGRFMDTAAVMKNLDLVITIDTSICHLAAGLDVPTWNLLPNPPDWRWMLDCDSTPWYPNMRLFRQPVPGDWTSVMQLVISELKAHLEEGKPLISFKQPYA